ncbi:bifunctional lytic transglycosylase/C40 family peptidase [Streptomyces smyrnaeus]|uniref:C40 family peptidase n=1 Tax=Streptomyces smyrnaeus TaxID=1387713 RepID=UPI0033E920BC
MTKAIGAALGAILFLLLLTLVGGAALTTQLGGGGAAAAASGFELPSRYAKKDIPAAYLALYQRAAPECPGLSWTILAAIGKVESNHGRHATMRSSAGALGPMQFLPATFHRYAHPVPPGGKRPPTAWDPVDAVYAAARMLCANGAKDGKDLRGALFAYNHADWYVRKVLRTSRRYGSSPAGGGAAGKALAFARSQLGARYVWGGDGGAEGGFDCSGLTKAAYAAAGITLPRTAEEQYRATRKIPAGSPLRPGDLVFYGRPGNLHHVGIYAGEGRMIHAPKPGTTVRYESYKYAGHDFYAATRPTQREHRR